MGTGNGPMFLDSNRWFSGGAGRGHLLFISGHTWKALILLVWCGAVAAQIDHLLRSYVISGRAKMHPLLVFFALLGGVSAFGVMGLFIGSLVMSLTLIVLQLTERGKPGRICRLK